MSAAPIAEPAPASSLAEAIAERWVSLSLLSWPETARPFLREEKDPFSNPIGSTLRRNLHRLACEVLGEMQEAAVASALEEMVRLRAVQDFSPGDAMRFVFDLRTAVRELAGAVPETIQARIDALALMAFSQYARCREQIYELRIREIRFRAQCATR